MKLYLIYNKKTILEFKIRDEIFTERKVVPLAHAKFLLDNFSQRITKGYNVILFFNEVLEESIKHYEGFEEYEICLALKLIKDSIDNEENRQLINKL